MLIIAIPKEEFCCYNLCKSTRMNSFCSACNPKFNQDTINFKDLNHVYLCRKHKKLFEKFQLDKGLSSQTIRVYFMLLKHNFKAELGHWNGKEIVDLALSRLGLYFNVVEKENNEKSCRMIYKDNLHQSRKIIEIPSSDLEENFEETFEWLIQMIINLKESIFKVPM